MTVPFCLLHSRTKISITLFDMFDGFASELYITNTFIFYYHWLFMILIKCFFHFDMKMYERNFHKICLCLIRIISSECAMLFECCFSLKKKFLLYRHKYTQWIHACVLLFTRYIRHDSIVSFHQQPSWYIYIYIFPRISRLYIKWEN